MPILKAFLRVRKKNNDGSFDELVARAFAAYEDSVEVCPLIEHEERKLLSEYLTKLSHGSIIIPDPLEISETSWISETQGILKWPSLYYHDQSICAQY